MTSQSRAPLAMFAKLCYASLVAVGTLFLITACAYGVMTYRSIKLFERADDGLMGLMRQRGMTILALELVALAVLAFASMGADRRAERRSKQGSTGENKKG
jgi:type VI protein secretion system component VasK